jgi:hypothetical protein
MAETAHSAPLGEMSNRDGKSASELKDQKVVGSATKETTEQGVPKQRVQADDTPQLLDETKKAVSSDIGAASSHSVGVTLGAFESEIERMSKDADAILDSIRNEAAESPNRIRRVVRDRREALNKAHDSDDDWDDDMSEELNRLGSVSEEIRQAEIDFMRGLVDLGSDAEGSAHERLLHGDAEDRDNATRRQPPGIKRNAQQKQSQKQSQKPLQKPPQEAQQEQVQSVSQQQVQAPSQTTGQEQLKKPPAQAKGRADPALIIGVILVYLVIMIHVLRVLRNGLLDAEGGLMPISLG